ncbi:MAG: hypothetical protein ACT4OS_11010 [Acidimicrobiales bacterium]
MRAVVSCVGENRPDWFRRMENLVLSVRSGTDWVARAPIVVNVVIHPGGPASGGPAAPEAPDADFTAAMARLDARVRAVAPVDARRPTTNKLRMFELVDEPGAEIDVLVALDCDMVVRGDIGAAVSAERLRMVPAGRDILPDATWRKLFGLLGLPLPPRQTVMAVTGQRTYPYFNSGVMLVPAEFCAALHRTWLDHLTWMFDTGLAQVGLDRLRKDQIPLATALAAARLSVDPLPVNLNLSVTAGRFAKPYRQQWGPPFILHYHRLIDEHGFLLASPIERINPQLDGFNRLRARHVGLPYSGLTPVSRVAVARARLKDLPVGRLARSARRRVASAPGHAGGPSAGSHTAGASRGGVSPGNPPYPAATVGDPGA